LQSLSPWVDQMLYITLNWFVGNYKCTTDLKGPELHDWFLSCKRYSIYIDIKEINFRFQILLCNLLHLRQFPSITWTIFINNDNKAHTISVSNSKVPICQTRGQFHFVNSTQFDLVNSNSTSNLSIQIQFQNFQFKFRLFVCLIFFTMSRYSEYLLGIHTPSS